MNDRFKFRVWDKARQCYIEPLEPTPFITGVRVMNDCLDKIQKALKEIHYPLCELEKYTFFNAPEEIDEEVQNIHIGYMKIQNALNTLRELNEVNNDR